MKAGQSLKHNFVVPNYCGSMKAFVVAYYNGKSGSADKTFFVRKPLMILTGAPRMMSAGELYKIPVTVFNMEKKAKKVNINMNLTGFSGYKYNISQPINFKAEGDEVIYFDLKIPDETGILHMELAASDGSEKARETIEIQVKPTQPVINHQQVITVAPGTTQIFNAAPKGMKGTYSSTLNVNDIRNFDLQNRLNYLIEYPHGCVEQTTSSAFAQLLLNEVQDINEQEAADIRKHVESDIKRLNQYQTYSGGFAYWPYQYDVNDFASVYVLHFMMEAKRKGFEIPKYIMDNAINYQKNQAGKYENNNTNGSYTYQDMELTQAYRLYLLAELNIADITAMNKFKESGVQSGLSKALLAKAYKIVGKGNTSIELMQGLSLKIPQTMSTSFSSSLRDHSMMLIALQNLGNTVTCQKLADDICAELSTGWNNTLATSMALVSLSRFYGLSGALGKQYTINGKAGILQKHSQLIKLSGTGTGSQITFRNNSSRQMYLVLNEYYSDIKPATTLINNGMLLRVRYMDMNNKEIMESDLKHGANFMAKIEVTNTTTSTLQNVALDYYIANGWQFISNRYIDDESINKSSSSDFKNMQDERINLFFTLAAKETKAFYLQLNASYKGEFFLPLSQSYQMYNERYKAQVAGKWVTVN
jgi:uncharacterized protein YfaS (alpha-2-macroglobulin family)